MNPREVLEFAKKHKVQMVDLKFVDLIGTWQHFSIPVEELTEGLFKDGSGLDGSSIRGWKAINDSDLLMIPDPSEVCIDPFCAVPTLSLVGNIVDPITREPYDRDPRFVAQKAEKYLQSTKIGDISYWGPEAEFFIFDQVRYDQTATAASTSSIPKKAPGTSGRKATTWAERSVTRKVTFRFHRPIRNRISAAR